MRASKSAGSGDEIRDLLNRAGENDLASTLKRNGLHALADVLQLSNADYADMGIKLGSRNRIRAAAHLAAGARPPPSSPAALAYDYPGNALRSAAARKCPGCSPRGSPRVSTASGISPRASPRALPKESPKESPRASPRASPRHTSTRPSQKVRKRHPWHPVQSMSVCPLSISNAIAGRAGRVRVEREEYLEGVCEGLVIGV